MSESARTAFSRRGLDLVEASPDLAFEHGVGDLEARDHAAAHRPDPTVIGRPVCALHHRSTAAALQDAHDQPGNTPKSRTSAAGTARATLGSQDSSGRVSSSGSRMNISTTTRR